MNPAKLLALAQRLRDHAATFAPNATREDMLEAARYLRACAGAEPVATVRVHDTGRNAGIAWTAVPTESAGGLPRGMPLYTHPQPPSAQAEVVEELAALARFGAACLIASREDLCDLDGGWLQDVAEATGCLGREERAEPCGADCRCADEGDSFPTQCLRAPDRLWRLAVSLDAGKETSR